MKVLNRTSRAEAWHTVAPVAARPIPALRAALVTDYTEAAEVVDDTTDDFLRMMFVGERSAAARALARYLHATGEYATVDAAAVAITEGTVDGLTEPPAPVYGPDGFLPINEEVPF